MKKIIGLSFLLVVLFSTTLNAQNSDLTLKASLSKTVLEVGETVKISAEVDNEKGKAIKGAEFQYFSRRSKVVSVDNNGNVKAVGPGEGTVFIIYSPGEDKDPLRESITIKVNFPPVTKIEISNAPSKVYVGSKSILNTTIIDKSGVVRKDLNPKFQSSDASIAEIDAFGNIVAKKAGQVTITAYYEKISSTIKIDVTSAVANQIKLTAPSTEFRTGDVVHFSVSALDAANKKVNDLPIYFSFTGVSDDVSSTASGLIKQDGRFVADVPGIYTITASSGSLSNQMTVKVQPRNVKREVQFIGHGNVNTKHTSDFWVWEGADGKDYAVTGTWGADGTAYFWDVSDPANMIKIDSVQVDARTVNDVKISEDGKICVISREGASNRKNGLVVLDVTNPRDVKTISTFTENLTGGVHNVFLYKNHVFALSAGRKYYIISLANPAQPKVVSEFELDTPGHAIHDVWVVDGIAYSSNWSDGVQLVDVGNGIAGGSLEKPVQFASYTYPSGANHAAFPFKSESAGKFYVVAGDEIFPYGLNMDRPNIAGGFLHFVDFTDLEHPDEIARFEVPNAGSHNYWIENDILYVSFYNGGVRMVDVSGELMGDLYKQGREIGWFIPADPNGYVPNAPFTWGAQPYKGHVFMSDWNSGLWSIKLAPEKPENVSIEVK